MLLEQAFLFLALGPTLPLRPLQLFYSMQVERLILLVENDYKSPRL